MRNPVSDLCLLLILFVCPGLFGQGELDEGAQGEGIYELSPFVVDVSQDEGYRATNATSGTRLNTAIKDLPMSLEVITTEFIADTGATDLQESLAYSAGVALDSFMQGGFTGSSGPGANATSIVGAEVSPSASGNVGDITTNAVSIRGFTAPFQQRMGFRIGTTIPLWGITLGATVDAVSIERNEILRGPGALLYGIGVISGIVNVIPKTPLPEPRQVVTFGVGDNEYKRATFDATGPIAEGDFGRLSYRVATAHMERGDWTDFFLDKRGYYTAQLEYEYSSKVNLLMEYQRSDTRFEGLEQQYLYEDFAEANRNDYRNEFNEKFNWGMHYGDHDHASRVTGPDTYYQRDEETYLANLQVTPLENLSFNTGVFVADQETERFTTQMNLFNNRWAGVSVVGHLEPDQYLHVDNPPDPDNPNADTDDYKAIAYWWTKRPQKAYTVQYRAEMTYELETPGLLSQNDRHNFLMGFHYIEDDIDFWRGIEPVGDVHRERAPGDDRPINEDDDAFYVRDFHDFSPLRYNGEQLAQPGDQYSSATLWYRGFYGVYHGRFLNEKLTAIGGHRLDSYQAYQENWVREPYDPTNQKLGVTGGTHFFEESESVQSTTGSLGFALTDHVSIYGLVAEGISPNVGQADGNREFFPSERTRSEEIGIKFDVMDRKISGTISFYRITRENALWNWDNAPNPKSWADSIHEDMSHPTRFDPSRVESGDAPLSYGVDISYFDIADFNGWTPDDRRDITHPSFGLEGIVGYSKVGAASVNFEGVPTYKIYLDYNKLDEAGWRDEIEAAWVEARTRAQPDDIDPISYGFNTNAGHGNNPSANTSPGAVVSFTDEAVGMDFQIIVQPTDNWQMVLSYAHTEREAVTGFQMVDAVSLANGQNYGTEYDIWVRDLGRENFEDPTRPSTATGGGVKGLSLSFVPEDTASIWSNYKFRHGLLKGFELGLGAIYQGPAQTSVPIGGTDLASNRYRTPDTKELIRINSALTYKHSFEDFDLRVSLNVYNLLETDPYHENRVTYDNLDTGGVEHRRSFYYVQPRNFRVTTTISF